MSKYIRPGDVVDVIYDNLNDCLYEVLLLRVPAGEGDTYEVEQDGYNYDINPYYHGLKYIRREND